MTRTMAPRPMIRGVSFVVALGLLTGCAQGPLSTQSARIGPDDGSDACRQYVVALDSTGNYFGADILKGAAMGAVAGGLVGGLIGGNWKGALIGAGAGAVLGGAAGYWGALQQQASDQATLNTRVRGDLNQENVAIDKTQLAFNQLMDCRFRQAGAIQADYAARRIDRPTAISYMSGLKQRAQRDLAIASQINGQIASRGAQFDVAADNLAPGATARPRAASRSATLRSAAPLKLRPDAGAPEIASLPAQQQVTISPAKAGYVLVETPSGQRGYAPADAISGGASMRQASTSQSDDVRSLAGSNAARRDDFAQSVTVSERAVASGFELAS